MNFDNPTKSYGTAMRYAKLKLNLERLDVYANLAYDYHDDVSVLCVERNFQWSYVRRYGGNR